MTLLTPMLLEEGGGGVNPLAFDPSAFMLTLIIFVILLGLLIKFAWDPILNALDARERRIEESVNAAQNAKREAEEMLAQYQQKLRDAERQVAQRIDEGRAMADRQAQEILDKAQAQAAREREGATRDIELAKQKALADIQAETVRLSKLIAEKVLAREVDDKDHQRLAQELLAGMR